MQVLMLIRKFPPEAVAMQDFGLKKWLLPDYIQSLAEVRDPEGFKI